MSEINKQANIVFCISYSIVDEVDGIYKTVTNTRAINMIEGISFINFIKSEYKGPTYSVVCLKRDGKEISFYNKERNDLNRNLEIKLQNNDIVVAKISYLEHTLIEAGV